MCEVTQKNFEEIYPQVVDDLNLATFIAIDCEFNGLFDDSFKCSFFDSPKARYQKLQDCLDIVKIIQFGLSAFKYESTKNEFSVSSYCFYLKPSPVIKKQKFTYQMGSLEFLCRNNFNFNKLFYDGVFYLNESHKKQVLSMIEDGSLVNVYDHEDIQQYCSRVAEWSGSASEGSEMMLELTKKSKMFVYILHGEIRKRFPKVWTFFAENNIIIVKKINNVEKTALSTTKEETLLKKKLLDSILGFTNVIKQLENLKKPIIGHNLFVDLILIYKQFYNPLPVSYKTFKAEITKIFPIIYDTKLMSVKLRDFVSKDNAWNSNNLSSLYTYLKDGRGSTLVMYTPAVNHKNESLLNEGHFHEAGYDSYCTGYCFLKLAHIFSLWNEKKRSFLLTSFPVSSKWLLRAVSGMKNKVNLPRAQVEHIVLDGVDPDSVRPSLMYIYSRTKQPLDFSKISEIIAKYSAVDIQPISKNSGLLAARSRYQVREIRNCFKNHEDYAVTTYNFFKHSKSGRSIVSGTVILSVVFILILTSNKWR